MAAHRRRDALQRVLFMFEREFDRERKGREGLEYLNEVYDRSPQTVPSNNNERRAVMAKIRSVCLRPTDSVNKCSLQSTTLLTYIDYHIYKLRCAMHTFARHSSSTVAAQLQRMPEHSLSQFEERVKDKAVCSTHPASVLIIIA